MSETPESDEIPIEDWSVPPAAAIPDELPPVEPPSARFIVQLFVVPGLIVLAIVGVWALFGRLSSADQDWTSLVNEMRTTNEHRRWRGAYGLAQVLDIDGRRGESGQRLAANRDIAQELCRLTSQQLEKTNKTEDDLKQLQFLTRTLGMLDVTDLVLPVLQKSMQADQDREVRKNAIASISLIAGRAADTGLPVEDDSLFDDRLVDDLIAVTTDTDPIVRQLATFSLGLISGDKSQQRLMVLLESGDANTRVNAAIGLSRQKSTGGYSVFMAILDEASGNGPTFENPDQKFQHLVALKNTIKAVGDLAAEFSSVQRTELSKRIEHISEQHNESRIRVDAKQTLNLLTNVQE